MCHELAHSLRWEKVPEYAETIFDGIILEGMAVVLEEEAMITALKDNFYLFSSLFVVL
ncbi:hypothetical protein EUA63_02545 [TM7 phylum sp. oral taxon 348]|jgi:hypothetical protein|nr:hypothetical protein EUA63_02545 [TM7 phylum sp. oral taxon 348]TWP27531.1 hypothetical protein EUA62_01475 [TM7 phylum sp. oral taxon 348]